MDLSANAVVDSVFVLIALVLGLIPLTLSIRFKAALQVLTTSAKHPAVASLPTVTLILPCKGVDPNFRENILSMIAQRYPGLELLFVVATKDDLAYSALDTLLKSLEQTEQQLRCQLLVAGICHHRAQKLTNQLAGVAHSTKEVLVFLDSDICLDPDFVARLVAPLSEPKVGVSSGYRWYHPPRPTLGSMLKSTWNAGAFPFLVDPKRNFAWGGAMAIRRDVFEATQIAAVWDNALSDDLSISTAVRKHGKIVRFVPECIALSFEEATVAQAIEFTNRQSLISRIYLPSMWWSAAIGHGLPNLLILYGLVRLVQWMITGDPAYIPGIACLILLPLQLFNAWLLCRSLQALLPQIREEFVGLRWYYILVTPLTSILTLVNTIHAASTRRITWRGITYEMQSPTKTVILHAEPSDH